MQRRAFLKTAAGAVAGAQLWRARAFAAPAQAASAEVTVLLNEPIATISPAIYGHFTEHLGGVIYGGVWVGENSKVPNLGGIRRELVEKLKAIHAPVIRWPGGCFADSYDWRDGVGPRARRPRRTNFWVDDAQARALHNSPQQFDPNTFGTSEFVRFCQLAGAEPYLAANVRSLPALEFDHWVEYCNAPQGSSSYADLRAADGSPAPYGVRLWGIGNESWGCGGNFTPEEYAAEYRRFTSWIPRYGVRLQLVASGPNADDVDWTTRFFENILGRRGVAPPFGWSVHNYTFERDALAFDPDDYYATLRQAFTTEKVILDHWTAMGVYDTRRRVRLVVDEYGDWYHAGTAVDPSHIFGQQITMRDALSTALTLDTFNRHADKVALAASAQLINCINALFLAHEDQFVATPNYDVFALYAAHQGATAVRTEFAAPAAPGDAKLWGLNGSASYTTTPAGRQVTVTLVQPRLDQPLELRITLPGSSVRAAEARVLAAADVHAHNTFAAPHTVAARTAAVQMDGASARYLAPAASVSRITLTLGA